jgi:hypothetical protein
MKIPKSAVAFVALAASLLAPHSAAAVPRTFFGIVPQTPVTEREAEYMRAGRIGSLRLSLSWASVQARPGSPFEWSGFDAAVATAAQQQIRILPVLGGVPRRLAHKQTTLPVQSAAQRRGWAAFVRAAVERYGARGTFWSEHAPGTADFVPRLPIREWQVWNEPNFFYFAKPVSPGGYARLVKLSRRAMSAVEPRAKLILGGLFGEPAGPRRKAMPAAEFLDRLYSVHGLKRSFDGVALHPYAADATALRGLTERLRRVMVANRDRRAGLYITEMGWGSQNDPNVVSFERGPHGQVREMRNAYRYLIGNRHRLNLKGVYWFTWKDVKGACNFCDSTGFFGAGSRFKPKPVWRAFVNLTGGRARP